MNWKVKIPQELKDFCEETGAELFIQFNKWKDKENRYITVNTLKCCFTLNIDSPTFLQDTKTRIKEAKEMNGIKKHE